MRSSTYLAPDMKFIGGSGARRTSRHREDAKLPIQRLTRSGVYSLSCSVFPILVAYQVLGRPLALKASPPGAFPHPKKSARQR